MALTQKAWGRGSDAVHYSAAMFRYKAVTRKTDTFGKLFDKNVLCMPLSEKE